MTIPRGLWNEIICQVIGGEKEKEGYDGSFRFPHKIKMQELRYEDENHQSDNISLVAFKYLNEIKKTRLKAWFFYFTILFSWEQWIKS